MTHSLKRDVPDSIQYPGQPNYNKNEEKYRGFSGLTSLCFSSKKQGTFAEKTANKNKQFSKRKTWVYNWC